MKKFILGFVLGALLTSGVVWAKSLYIVLQDGTGKNVGTTANPLFVTTS